MIDFDGALTLMASNKMAIQKLKWVSLMKYKKHLSRSLARSLWLFVLLRPVEKGSGKSAWDVALSAGKSSGLDHDDS